MQDRCDFRFVSPVELESDWASGHDPKDIVGNGAQIFSSQSLEMLQIDAGLIHLLLAVTYLLQNGCICNTFPIPSNQCVIFS